MNSFATFNTMLQAIAVLLIFVATYFAFLISIIICLVAAELISERPSMVRDCGVRPVSLGTRSYRTTLRKTIMKQAI
jgi:hypothetical protein